MNIITIDYGPDQEPERIEKVTSIEFAAAGIFVFYQTIYGVDMIEMRFLAYNSYVTITIH